MPDLTHQPYWYCLSAEQFSIDVKSSDGKKTYTVNHGHFHKQREIVELGFSCTCPSYQYGNGEPCKHITKAAADKYCGWYQFVDGGDVVMNTDDKPQCPNCQGPAQIQYEGV